MKLEKYIEQEGALFKPRFRQVPDNNIALSKGMKLHGISEIVVEVKLEDGEVHTFQGCEDSQNRLIRAGWCMEKLSVKNTEWKTADNKIVKLSVKDIANILYACVAMQTDIWL